MVRSALKTSPFLRFHIPCNIAMAVQTGFHQVAAPRIANNTNAGEAILVILLAKKSPELTGSRAANKKEAGSWFTCFDFGDFVMLKC
jgi:hypothetical protein